MFSDLADMIVKTCAEVLGDECTYSYQDGGSDTFYAIYVKDRDVYENEQGIITGVSEVISAPLSSFSKTPKQGDTLVVNDINYKVIDDDPDGIDVVLYLGLV